MAVAGRPCSLPQQAASHAVNSLQHTSAAYAAVAAGLWGAHTFWAGFSSATELRGRASAAGRPGPGQALALNLLA